MASDDRTIGVLLVTTGLVLLASTQYALIQRLLTTWISRWQLQWFLLLRPKSKTATISTSTSSCSSSYSSSSLASTTTTAITGVVGKVTGLYIYPVKSLRAVSCSRVVLDDRGFRHDRCYMIVTAQHHHARDCANNDNNNGTMVTYRFLTQRQCPRLATIIATLNDGTCDNNNNNNNNEYELNTLTLTMDVPDSICHQQSITIPAIPSIDSPIYQAGIWNSTVSVQDMGDAVAAFLQQHVIATDDGLLEEYQSLSVRLVRQMPTDQRLCDGGDRYVPRSARTWWGQAPRVALNDGFPILVASETSLAELNHQIQIHHQQHQHQQQSKDNQQPISTRSIPMNRFRPNIVIGPLDDDGDDNSHDSNKRLLPPFAEDEWKVIRIGGSGSNSNSSSSNVHGGHNSKRNSTVLLHIVKGCPRCKQSCTDQLTGHVDLEPFVTLSQFRIKTTTTTDVYFAQNAVAAPGSAGQSIAIGDVIEVLQVGEPVWNS